MQNWKIYKDIPIPIPFPIDQGSSIAFQLAQQKASSVATSLFALAIKIYINFKQM